MEKLLIEETPTTSIPHYQPYGWHHWPDHPWMSYQFRRALGLATRLAKQAASPLHFAFIHRERSTRCG